MGAKKLPRLSVSQSCEVRAHVLAGRTLYGNTAVDQGIFEMHIASISPDSLPDDENVFYSRLFAIGLEAKHSLSLNDSQRADARRKIDEAMTPAKDRKVLRGGQWVKQGMLKRHAAMLVRSIVGLQPVSIKIATDDWHRKAIELISEFGIDLYEGIAPSKVPPLFCPSTAIADFLASVEKAMLAGGMRNAVARSQAIRAIDKYLRSHNRRMASSFCDLALDAVEKHGYEYSTTRYEQASELLGTILDAIAPVSKGKRK